MFCYQCEQTINGKGCHAAQGVCGKDNATACLQDILLAATKGISCYADALIKQGIRDTEADRFVVQALFVTITNVDFDPSDVEKWINQAVSIRDSLARKLEKSQTKGGTFPKFATFKPAAGKDALIAQAADFGVESRKTSMREDAAGVLEMIVYGLKGAAAYADHALRLGKEDAGLYASFHAGLAFVAEESADMDKLLGWALKTGEINLKAMELLDAANTGTFGHPVPTPVRVTPIKGKAILVSGHDLKDLKDLLQQTADMGINVYTHGEMLPCHGYPELKKYPHLAGNYGGAWQDQQKEFDAFPGPILMTTNCIQKPRDTYKGRIFTTGLVQWPGVKHVENGKFRPLIDAALAAPGFTETQPEKSIIVGFGHNAVLGVADKVIDAVKGGKVKHFFLVGGCDGAKPGRNYYTEFVEKAPKDTIILTLACGKFRFNKLDLGMIGVLPRLLDIGQCNDAYSAIRIAVALAEAFKCGVNDLPLSLVLSWYEQKAVAILLTLLHLGIKNIRLGPTLPAFVTPAVLQVLVDKFAIKPVTTPEKDLADILKA